MQEVGNDSIIERAKKPAHGKKVVFSPKHELRLRNFGHTQTWIYAKSGRWFVGAKPRHTKSGNYGWDTELARVRFPKGSELVTKLSSLPHLTHLNYATDVVQAAYPHVKRSQLKLCQLCIGLRSS